MRASFAKLVFAQIDARICFFGHTHQVAVYRSDGESVVALPRGVAPHRIELDDAYYLVNPGSVGQPRDGDARASFAIFDNTAWTIEFHRVEYDSALCLKKAQAAGLLAPPSRLSRLLPRALRR